MSRTAWAFGGSTLDAALIGGLAFLLYWGLLGNSIGYALTFGIAGGPLTALLMRLGRLFGRRGPTPGDLILSRLLR